MIIVVHCHGGQKGTFPNWTPPKPGPSEGPTPAMFYFAVWPGNPANRITDVYARNLILNMDGSALAVNGQHLAFSNNQAVTPIDFVPNVTPGKPISFASRGTEVLNALQTSVHNAGGPVWDKPTCRLWPDAAATQQPMPDYELEPYASGQGAYTPNATWGDWPAHSGGPLNGRVNPRGQVWCVNSPETTLSATVKKAWKDAQTAGLMGAVAVVCLFCRS